MNYSLIIPIYNEEKTLKELLNQLEKYIHEIEIIIINDGSTDKTKYILDQQDKLKIINNPYNKGKGYSLISGIKLAANENIILMDGDLEIDMKCIPEIIQKYEIELDAIVVGSRWKKESITSGMTYIHNLGNYLINFLFNFLYNTNLNDVLCCVKVINKKLLMSLNLSSHAFSIEIEIMSKLALLNKSIFEVDVIYNRRKKNEGKKLRISDGWSILGRMISVKLNNYKT
jgi:glycosyltransferase involved in cell wall biosynthesis